MGILKKLFGNEGLDDIETPPCPHTSLSQRWENPEDMGNRELATYECSSCGRLFTYDEIRSVLEPGGELEPAGNASSRRD